MQSSYFHRQVAAFPSDPPRFLFSPADFPTVNGLFCMKEPLLTYSSPSGVLIPSCFFFSFFFFLSSYWLYGDFSCTSWCLRSSTSVQQVLCENCSICRCILDVLVRRGEFCNLLFCQLDSPPHINFRISLLIATK